MVTPPDNSPQTGIIAFSIWRSVDSHLANIASLQHNATLSLRLSHLLHHTRFSSMASNAAAAAPWRPQFETHLSKLPSPEFVLSTIHRSSSSAAPLPRARYCIMRGFWANLPENKHNKAPQNPAIYDSDLLTFTTDVRMEKYEDLSRDGVEKGGDAEAVFWVKDVMCQWRIRGRAFVIGGGEEQEKPLREELQRRMRKLGDGEWSWEKEITAHWGNLSPAMRGTLIPSQQSIVAYRVFAFH